MREVLLQQAHDKIGHPSYKKSIAQLMNLCYWKTMKADLQEYIASCDECQRVKERTTLLPGMMQQMPIPTRRGQSVGMDWPSVKVRAQDSITKKTYDAILVIIDLLTRLAVLIPTTNTTTAQETAVLLFEHWYKRFGLPDSIISGRDPKLTSEYWTNITKQLGIQRKMPTAYHNRRYDRKGKSLNSTNSSSGDYKSSTIELVKKTTTGRVQLQCPYTQNYRYGAVSSAHGIYS